MTTTKHTPGPWKRSRRNITADGVIVARLLAAEGGPEQEAANAHLIAAAPDLLEALEGCVRALEAHDATVATRLDMHEAAALVRGQDAIAKATGETP